MEIDEGPSDDDLQRFDRDTAYCPACGAEIWDQAEFCPDCGAHVGGETSGLPPGERARRKLVLTVIGVIAAAGFLLLVLRLW